MTHRKKLIEVALPLEAINDASAAEKANPFIKGHPRSIHTWFARRPLVTCRAMIFASLVDDPEHPDAAADYVEACRNLPRGKNAAELDTPRRRLFDFIETLVQYKSTGDEKVFDTARNLISLSSNGNPPSLLDPFAGGGSIPLEAQRLGLKVFAGDLNPIAVVINKAQIEFPLRFAAKPPVGLDIRSSRLDTVWQGYQGLASDIRHYGDWMLKQALKRISPLYPKGPNGETVKAWLWARTVKCPNPACGANIPLISSYRLTSRKGRLVWLEPQVDVKHKAIEFSVKTGKGKVPKPPKVGQGVKFRCLVCREIAPEEHIRDEGASKRMGSQLIAIVTEAETGNNFNEPTSEHAQAANVSAPDEAPNTDMPQRALGFRIQRYGMTKHRDLFTPRQLVTLSTFRSLIEEAREQIYTDALEAGWSDDRTNLNEGGEGAWAYAQALSVYLSFALDRWTDYSTTLCAWNVTNENVKHTFGRNALPMVWDYVEANLLGKSLSFRIPVNWVATVVERMFADTSPLVDGAAFQADAANLDDFDELRNLIVSTDPPYYDNIGYADLSDFYYVWLRTNLQSVFPEIFSTMLVPKLSELIADASRFCGDNHAAERHFEGGLRKAFSNIREMSHPDYPMTVFYAFKQTDRVDDHTGTNGEAVVSTGWETMLSGLIEAGFSLTGTWPVRTERTSRVRDIGSNALASSIVLVCRPRPTNTPIASRREFVNALRRELPAALREMQSGNIAPVDMAQASIGPGMAVYSRYSKVLEPDGRPLTVRTALQLINHELDAYLAEQEGYIDEDSRFAVAWFEQFGFKEGPFGQADVLARAKNTSVDGLAYAGVLESGAGKVRLLHWSELDPGWDPATDKRLAVWEAVHHLIERLNTHGEEGAAMLLAKMPSSLAAEARQLAYRLYSICERKGWAEHARDYNALVISWGASQEQASAFREQYQQGRLL